MSGFLRAAILDSRTNLEHGFGTRDAALPAGLATVKQIHSNLLLIANTPGTCGDGDAIVTNRPSLAVSIRTADCYPILLADIRRGAVAAVHAGWRGSASQIVRKTLEKMNVEFGTNSSDVVAAIGPGIGVCCYEVGEDVASQFGPAGVKRRAYLDLASENRTQLEAGGVLPENIEALDMCTFCHGERFFSYRRDREGAGRMTSFIRLLSSEIKPR